MMDRTLEDTFYMMFTTRAFATGIPGTLGGTPVVSAYEDNSLTQITAGITLGVDHDGVTGLNLLTLVATAANGYEAGKDYNMVITTGTVGGVSVVGEAVGSFSLGLSAAAVDLANGTDGLGAIKTVVDAIPTTAMRGTDSAATETKQDIIDTVVAAIKAVTDVLPDAGALNDLATILADTADMQPLIEKMAYVGPLGLGVWIDDGAANTNTVLGTDGTPDNPISTIAAATTVATALGSQRFYLVNDTQITLAQTYEGYEFVGVGVSNQVTLGSQDVDNTLFRNVILTGTQGGTQFMRAIDCQLQAILSAEILADFCWLTGDITLRAATNHSFGHCKSGIPGSGTPDLTFPGSGTTSVNFRHYSGGLTVKSATTLDTMSYESDGQLIIDATCTSLDITVRGNCTITDNGTTTVLTQDAAVNRTNINAEADTALSDYDGPTKAEMDTAHALLATAANLATVDTVVDAIKAVTDLLPNAGALSDLAAILADTNELQTDDVPGLIAALNDLSAAGVNAEVVDALATDIIAELTGIADAPATPTHRQAIMLIYMWLRNDSQSTSSERRILNDAGAEIMDAVTSDDATTFSQGKLTDP